MENFLATVCPGPQTLGTLGGSYPPNFFMPPKFCCAQKNVFETYDENKNLSPIQMYLSPQTLKPDYGPDSAKIVSAIRIFCFEGHSASRRSITSKTLFRNNH